MEHQHGSSCPIPVIAIDGPSASGKGTVAARVAQRLHFHYLDSGALYRLVALAASRAGVSLEDEPRLASLAGRLDARFADDEIWLDGEPVGLGLRSEACSQGASRVAAWPTVREALLARQRAFRQAPGLVADGRDMGSVVFPEATLKIFLTASAEVRADRRYKQLIEKGLHANMEDVLRDVRQRDERDSTRAVAPLKKGVDARLLDTTGLSIDDAVEAVLAYYRQVCPC
ncbi:MAG: (d)CMP kinase [Betaproteobacteria bacterium]|nr:(d)CMP kinase [Betaproteobacteria bacterium]